MSDVKTFRAASMQEALDLVRDELGVDAVILHTKQVEQKGRLPWSRKRSEVEITAGVGVNVGAKPAPKVESPPVPTPRPLTAPPTPTGTGRTSAADILAAMEKRGSLDALAAELERSSEIEKRPPRVDPPAIAPPAPHLEHLAAGTREADEFTQKLDRIQRMLEAINRTTRTSGAEIPEELFHVYTDLIDADVDDESARDLVERLREECRPDDLGDAGVVRDRLHGIVRGGMQASGPIEIESGHRRVVALVGPTGVGKTTTIAKLAANFRLREGVKMGLVTVDTYRIAAVEQLRTYAEIIDLPMKVVTSPPEMRRALEEFAGLDLVLVDTAGRSPRDDLQIQELKSLLAEAHCDEVHLVLSLTSSLRGLETTAAKFKPAGVTQLILTKLDEAAGLGSLYSAARRLALPVSYLTNGQDVPDDIEPARVERMTRLVLDEVGAHA